MHNAFAAEYGLDVKIEGGDTLEEFFESNEDCNECGMFVSYKKYLKLACDNEKKTKVYHWASSKYCIIEDIEEVYCDSEFATMKEYICNYFNLKDNDGLKLVNFDDDTDVDDGETCKTAWEELVDNDDTIFCKILVSCEIKQEAVKEIEKESVKEKEKEKEMDIEIEKEKEKKK